MQEAAQQHDSELRMLDEREKKLLARNYAFLSDVAGYTSPMYGWAGGYLAQKAKQVERILEQMDRLYMTTYTRHGHLNSEHFFAQRRALFSQLDQAVNGMVRREIFGGLGAGASIKRQLGISTKATVHQWKASGRVSSVDGMKGNYQALLSASKAFSRLGYVAIGLDVIGGVANVAEVCAAGPDTDPCSKAKFAETGRVVGSIGGGMLGGSAAVYGTCNLLFALETAGTSLLWCAVVAGAAGSYAGSRYGGDLGQATGQVIYKVGAK